MPPLGCGGSWISPDKSPLKGADSRYLPTCFPQLRPVTEREVTRVTNIDNDTRRCDATRQLGASHLQIQIQAVRLMALQVRSIQLPSSRPSE